MEKLGMRTRQGGEGGGVKVIIDKIKQIFFLVDSKSSLQYGNFSGECRA